MASVRVDVTSSLGNFSFTAEVDGLRNYLGEPVNGNSEGEIAKALGQAFSAARRAYEIKQPAEATAADAWDEGYNLGIDDSPPYGGYRNPYRDGTKGHES